MLVFWRLTPQMLGGLLILFSYLTFVHISTLNMSALLKDKPNLTFRWKAFTSLYLFSLKRSVHFSLVCSSIRIMQLLSRRLYILRNVLLFCFVFFFWSRPESELKIDKFHILFDLIPFDSGELHTYKSRCRKQTLLTQFHNFFVENTLLSV